MWKEVLLIPPSAELCPDGETDEQTMKCSYQEIETVIRMKNEKRYGLHSMRKTDIDPHALDIISNRYRSNRHKQSVMTPSLHATSLSVENKTFDLRPLFYK